MRPRRRTPDLDAARAIVEPCGERVRAHARTQDGALVVATSEALHAADPESGGERLRWPWDRVVSARWDADARALAVTGSSTPGERSRALTLRLDEATRLLEVVRSEVTSNVVVSQRIESVRHGGAWVTARRVPGSDEIRWSVVFDPGTDPSNPDARAWADEHVTALRVSTGV